MANNLTLTNPAFDTTGEAFGSAALNGGYGVAPGGMIPGFPCTWECKFRRTSAPSSLEVIMGQSGVGWFGMTPSGQIQFETGGFANGTNTTVDFTSTGTAADGEYHHAAISATATGYTALLDGQVVGSSGAAIQNAMFQAQGSAGNQTGYMGVRNHGGQPNFQFGGEVDEAAVWATNRYTGAFTPPTAPYTGSEPGLLALWHLDGNGTDSTITAGSGGQITNGVIVVASNPAIVWSPYNWANGKTINPGAYLRLAFTGNAIQLNFDMSAQSAPYPEIWVSIDGQPAQQFTLAASVTPAMPSATAAWPLHSIELLVKSTSEFVTRWNPQNAAVVLTSITLASGATVAAPARLGRNVLAYGDSITEAYHVVTAASSGQTDTDGSDAALGWAYMLRRLLGCEIGVVGFGGTGLLNAGQGGVPPVGQSFAQLWSGQARTFTPTPDLIIINEGENDRTAAPSSFQPAFQSFLVALLAAVPRCPVAVLRPFSGAQAAAIQAAIQAIGSPRLHYIDTTGLFDTTLSVDGQHPLGIANLQTIAPGVATRIAPLLGAVANRWTH